MGYKILLLTLLLWQLSVIVLAAPIVGPAAASDSNNEDICQEDEIGGNLVIDCSDRELTAFPSGLNTAARILHLNNNNFVLFPPEVEQFSELEEISLAGNLISGHLPAFVQNWQHLSVLNMSNNNFDTWSRYRLKSLTTLDLSRNKIVNVDESAFNGMPELSYLDMAENKINNLPTNILMQNYKLETVILAGNYFSQIPNFHSFSLRTLDLSGCQINTLHPDSLFGKTSLWELNLSINEIDALPDNIASSTLQIMDLSYNDIGVLSDQTFSSLPHLAVLDLRGNDFKDVWATSIFSSNPFLREVRVKGNRWTCDGFSINLLLTYEFLTRDPPKVADATSLICYSPSNVTQLSWQDAYLRTWNQDGDYGSLTMTAIMIGVIIGVIITSVICHCFVNVARPDPPNTVARQTESQNLNPTVMIETTSRTERTVMRIPLSEDLPPSYDEALLMPTLNTSFHSLPGIVEGDEEVDRTREFRRSRSIGDLVESRPRAGDRRSVRSPRTVVNIEEQ